MPRLKLRASEAWCRLERQMPKSVCISAPKERRRLLWTQARAAHAPAASTTCIQHSGPLPPQQPPLLQHMC